jgi:long-subunit acyl-CoA synthetase (AMP-forming)
MKKPTYSLTDVDRNKGLYGQLCFSRSTLPFITTIASLNLATLLSLSCLFFKFLSGLTETCAGSFISLPNDMNMLGTVGLPLQHTEVRLESVPEMGYDALGNTSRGEVCMRGKTLFSGYYKRDDLLKEVMIDGWFHTGMLYLFKKSLPSLSLLTLEK